MHDRRLDGKTLRFGNNGALFRNAMTWWDHQTSSVWSQPWGTALFGDLKARALTQIPAELTPWGTWLAEHPDTTVLESEQPIDDVRYRPQRLTDDFVIGVGLVDQAQAFRYSVASREEVINEFIGEFPVAVFVNPETRSINVYLRRPASPPKDATVELPDVLTFSKAGTDRVTDSETGSTWDTVLGAAVDGPLRGALLQQLPFQSAWDWAWEFFFPQTTFYME